MALAILKVLPCIKIVCFLKEETLYWSGCLQAEPKMGISVDIIYQQNAIKNESIREKRMGLESGCGHKQIHSWLYVQCKSL